MNLDKTLQVVETEEWGYRGISLIVKTVIAIDPDANIPDEFIAHALCNNLREYVNNSSVSEKIIKYVHEPIEYAKDVCK